MHRFAEQSYLLLYYTIYWTWGIRLFIQETPSGFSKSGSFIPNLLLSLWTDFPKLYVGAAMKFYYLSQLAFWVQQIVVIHLEERRHDHYQMLTHHFVTVALMSTSYAYRQWRVGNAILACMDIVDLVFPVSILTLLRPSDELTHPLACQNSALSIAPSCMRCMFRPFRHHMDRRSTRCISEHLLEYLGSLWEILRHVLPPLLQP
jgi:hypothetical protein